MTRAWSTALTALRKQRVNAIEDEIEELDVSAPNAELGFNSLTRMFLRPRLIPLKMCGYGGIPSTGPVEDQRPPREARLHHERGHEWRTVRFFQDAAR